MRRYVTADAITSLRPGARFEMLHGEYDNLVWLSSDMTIPTKEEVEIELERLNTLSQSLVYREKRAAAYPTISEQLDLLYHQGYDGWKQVIKEVKDRFPKPE